MARATRPGSSTRRAASRARAAETRARSTLARSMLARSRAMSPRANSREARRRSSPPACNDTAASAKAWSAAFHRLRSAYSVASCSSVRPAASVSPAARNSASAASKWCTASIGVPRTMASAPSCDAPNAAIPGRWALRARWRESRKSASASSICPSSHRIRPRSSMAWASAASMSGSPARATAASTQSRAALVFRVSRWVCPTRSSSWAMVEAEVVEVSDCSPRSYSSRAS